MLKKRLMSMFLALTIVVGLGSQAFASKVEVQDIEQEVAPMGTARLVCEDGREYDIVGELVSTNTYRIATSGDNITQQTYRYEIPASLTAGGDMTVHESDTGFASTVYLTIYWEKSGEKYLLTSVAGHWEMHDDNVSVESTTLVYGCTGGEATQTNYLNPASVRNYFNVNTGFKTYISEWAGVMGANWTLNYLMGTSRRWKFTITNNLFNSGIDPLKYR